MKNEQIGKMLKKYRKLNKLSVSDVAVKLAEQYGLSIAEKTIYGWESNQAHPTTATFVALCDIYKINGISDIFSDTVEPKGFPITTDERQILEQYRSNPQLQPIIKKILDLE